MKLSKIEKNLLKTWKADLAKKNGFIGSFGRVTVVIEPTCRGKANISWAICSITETPKRKRGEFVALERAFCNREALPIEINSCSEDNTLYAFAENFACQVVDRFY